MNLPFAGFDVIEAPDGETALDLAAKEPLDIVLLDVMMPGVSGFDVAERLRARAETATLPIVFLSARADRLDVRRGFDLGAADYVTKPFDPVRLGDHLQAVLHAAEAGDLDRFRRARLAEDAP